MVKTFDRASPSLHPESWLADSAVDVTNLFSTVKKKGIFEVLARFLHMKHLVSSGFYL